MLSGVFITHFNQQPVSLHVTWASNGTSDLGCECNHLRLQPGLPVYRFLEHLGSGPPTGDLSGITSVHKVFLKYCTFLYRLTEILWKHWEHLYAGLDGACFLEKRKLKHREVSARVPRTHRCMPRPPRHWQGEVPGALSKV